MLYNLQTTNKYLLYTHILFKKHKYKRILHANVNINIHSFNMRSILHELFVSILNFNMLAYAIYR